MKPRAVEIYTPINVLHIITRLIVGGAQENTMYTASMLDKKLFYTDFY